MPDNELIGPKYRFGYENPSAFEYLKRVEGTADYQRTRKGKGPYFEDGRFYPATLGDESGPTIGYGHKRQPGEDFSKFPYSGGLNELQASDLLRADVDDRMKLLSAWYDRRYGAGEFNKLQPASKFVLMDTKYQSNDWYPKMAGHLRAGDTHSAMQESWTNINDPKQKAGERKRNLDRRLEAWPNMSWQYDDLGKKNPIHHVPYPLPPLPPLPKFSSRHPGKELGPQNQIGPPAPPAPPAPYGPPAPEAGIRLPRRPLFSD